MSEQEAAPKKTLYREQTVEDGETRYVPFVSEYGEVGYRIERPRRRPTYLYFNPSNTEDDDEIKPNVFVYLGRVGDPGYDTAMNWYPVDEPKEAKRGKR